MKPGIGMRRSCRSANGRGTYSVYFSPRHRPALGRRWPPSHVTGGPPKPWVLCRAADSRHVPWVSTDVGVGEVFQGLRAALAQAGGGEHLLVLRPVGGDVGHRLGFALEELGLEFVGLCQCLRIDVPGLREPLLDLLTAGNGRGCRAGSPQSHSCPLQLLLGARQSLDEARRGRRSGSSSNQDQEPRGDLSKHTDDRERADVGSPGALPARCSHNPDTVSPPVAGSNRLGAPADDTWSGLSRPAPCRCSSKRQPTVVRPRPPW